MQPNHKQDEIMVRAAHGRKSPSFTLPFIPSHQGRGVLDAVVKVERARVMPRNENCKLLILLDIIFKAVPGSDIHVAWNNFLHKSIRVLSG
jgi:hypothetical protein